MIKGKREMQNRKLTMVLCMLFLFAGNVAFAAQIKRIVSQPDLVSRDVWISIAGDIERGDAKKFQDVVYEMWQNGEFIYKVMLASNGGDVHEAMMIGEMIRDLCCITTAPYAYKYGNSCGFHTHGLEDNDHKEHINRNCNCVSACFLIWAAGVKRTGEVLGVHRPRFSKDYFKGLSASEARDKYTKLSNGVQAYLQKMDIPDHVIEKMFEYSSKEIFYLELKTVDALSQAPFFEEWLIANCNPLSDEEVRDLNRLWNKGNEKRSRADRFYMHSLIVKSGESNMCRKRKIRDAQKNIIWLDIMD